MVELIINKNKDVETICLVENGKIIEKYQNDEKTKKDRLEGNIYSAKVEDIVPGMQATFVNYGYEKNGLLHLKDAMQQLDETTSKNVDLSNKKISDIVKPKQKILIQVKKDSNDKKGAKVSTHISIPSRYIVYMPNAPFITVSQKITDEKTKQKLVNTVKRSIPEKDGAVIRTSAANVSEEEIKKDIQRCIKKWDEIQKKYNENDETKLVYESESIQAKILIDIKVDKVITNNQEEFNKLKELIQFEEIKGVKLEFVPKEDLLELYDLNSQINKSKERKIWLNCGGFITIDRTEALTAIDVNTGKFTGKTDLESTIFKVNKEATFEISKQLRLQDIGGIIIIDYIDMHVPENKTKIEELLKEQLKSDRAKTQVEGFTKLNLMELTRKHICSHLDE